MAILAAVLVPTVTSKIKDANVSAAISDINAIASGIQADLISLQSDNNNTTYLETATTAKADAKFGNCTVEYKAEAGEEAAHWEIKHNKYGSDVTVGKVYADGRIVNSTKA